MRSISQIARHLGVLRSLLSILAIILLVATPFSDPNLSPHGWEILRSVVLPIAAPMVFIVLMLDFMMVQIFKSQFSEGSSQRSTYIFIGKWNVLIGVLLLMVWLPVFLRATAV